MAATDAGEPDGATPLLPEIPEAPQAAPPANAPPDSPVADSAMATGADDEPEMSIGDKHAGDALPDPDGDGKLSVAEAATLLGDVTKVNNHE